MTILGKMMVFLVLVISLIFNFLTVNAYATRTNWRAEAIKHKLDAAKAAESANTMKTLIESEQSAGADVQRVLRGERDSYYSQNVTLREQIDELSTLFNNAFAAANQQSTEVSRLQANVAKLTKQIEDNDKMLASLMEQLKQQTLAAELAKVEAEKHRLAAEGRELQVERLSQRVNDQAQQLAAYRQQFGQLDPTLQRPQLPRTFRGTVQKVEGQLVQFTPGLDAGVVSGAELKVYRLKPVPKYLGTIRVQVADPKEASGIFTPHPGVRRPTPDDYPRPGDAVEPN